MKVTKQNSRFVLMTAVLAIVSLNPSWLNAQTTAGKPAENAKSSPAQWSVQINKVDPGDVQIAPSFQVAIYENLLTELRKTKRFDQVIRDGNRNAGLVSDLLILKTTVRKYTPGSETKRAVTTISGATKLTIQSQLCKRDGTVVLERTINGNVRFFGSNLRATRNLARNVAKEIKKASIPAVSVTAVQAAVF